MQQELFTAALGLTAPWRVERSEFDPEAGRLDLYLDFPRGARFACPEPGCPQRQCPVHDTEDKTWRHLDVRHEAPCIEGGGRPPPLAVAAAGVKLGAA